MSMNGNMDIKSMKYIIEASNNNKDKVWSFINSKYINANTKIKVTCLIHGEFESYYDSILKGMGCRKCSYLIKNNEKYYETLHENNLNQDIIYNENIEYAMSLDIPKVLRISNYLKEEVDMSRPIVVQNGVEKEVPKEYLNVRYYTEISTDDVAYFYKCALNRSGSYKNKEYREQYKELCNILKKVLDNRK